MLTGERIELFYKCLCLLDLFIIIFSADQDDEHEKRCGHMSCKQLQTWKRKHKRTSLDCFCTLLLSCGALLLCALIAGAATGSRSSELHLHFKRGVKWPATAQEGMMQDYMHAGTCTHTHLHPKLQEFLGCLNSSLVFARDVISSSRQLLTDHLSL